MTKKNAAPATLLTVDLMFTPGADAANRLSRAYAMLLTRSTESQGADSEDAGTMAEEVAQRD
ncbi:MAG: hypothetical protein WC749_12170 [Dehalococcoidia bacterium]